MYDHIRESLNRFEYSEQLKETAIFRVLFNGEELSQVATDLGIHSNYTLTHWIKSYQRTGPFHKKEPINSWRIFVLQTSIQDQDDRL